MPIEAYYKGRGKEVLQSMQKKYGKKKGTRIFYATAKKQHQRPQDESSGIIHRGIPQHIPGQLPEFSMVSEGIVTNILKKKAKDVLVRKLFRRNKIKVSVEDTKGRMELVIPAGASAEQLFGLKKDYIKQAAGKGMTPQGVQAVSGVLDSFIAKASG